MKKIKPDGRVAFHGELAVRAISSLPEGVVPTTEMQRPDNSQVVGHSESGHNHVATSGTYYRHPSNPLMAYLVVNEPVKLEHEKEGPTRHETHKLLKDDRPEIVWEIVAGREHVAGKGWQRSID